MKRKLQLLLSLVLFSLMLPAGAQKLKGYYEDVYSLYYPIVALPDSFKTYSISGENQGLDMKEFNHVQSPDAAIGLAHFKRVAEVADINIKVIYGKIKLYQYLTNNPINSIDDLKGYNAETLVDYEIPMSYEITDRRGIVIQKEPYGNDGKVHPIGSSLPAYRVSGKAGTVVKEATAFFNKGLQDINARIKELIDIYRKPLSIELYGIKASKTESYEEFSAVLKKLEESFKVVVAHEPTIQQRIKEAIIFWESKVSSFDQNSDEGKDHLFLCNYNLAVGYFLADDFQKSLEYVSKARQMGIKPMYTKAMEAEINKANRYKTQYLSEKEKLKQNPNNIYQGGKVEKSPLGVFNLSSKKSEEQAGQFMEKGFIVLYAGDTLFGEFVDFESNLASGKISFLLKGKAKRDFNSPYNQINNLSVQGSVYYPEAGGSLQKLIYRSANLIVLGLKNYTYFVFTKATNKVSYQGFSKDDASAYLANYKKRLAEVFKDICPAVEQKALSGTYDLKRSGDDVLKPAIEDYEAQCGGKDFKKNIMAVEESKIKARYK